MTPGNTAQPEAGPGSAACGFCKPGSEALTSGSVLTLMAADEADDPRMLAEIAWRLHGQVGAAQANIERLHGSLRSRSAGGSRPAAIGGSPGRAAGR
jgi:hypothetical protein